MITPATVAAAAIPFDVPVGWSDPKDVNMVHALLVLGLVPLALFVLITIAVYVPALLRGERPGSTPAPLENQWIGGPRAGIAELKGPQSEDTGAGGASGRW